jgi:hypothetical protein
LLVIRVIDRAVCVYHFCKTQFLNLCQDKIKVILSATCAISSPLKGDSGDAESCGVGSVILEEPGRPVSGHEPSEPDDQGNPGEDKLSQVHVVGV